MMSYKRSSRVAWLGLLGLLIGFAGKVPAAESPAIDLVNNPTGAVYAASGALPVEQLQRIVDQWSKPQKQEARGDG